MAIDPITLALIASGAQAAAGIGKTAFGLSQKKRGRQALASAYEAPIIIDKYDGQEYETGDEYIYWSN